MTTPIVEMTDISIEFPGVKALDGVSFHLFPGEVHALMGENGAGKSTLIKVLNGVYRADSGTIALDGREIHPTGPANAQSLGVAPVFQEVNLVENLTVAENIMLGHEPHSFWGINYGAMRRQAAAILEQLNLRIDPASALSDHSIAIQQLVAICRAVNVDAKVLILDEPTSSLDEREVRELFRVVRELRDSGVAILFVSHFLDQVFEISDRITVLRNGRFVGEHATADLDRHHLISAMIGKELAQFDAVAKHAQDAAEPAATGTPLIAAVGLGRGGSIQPIDLTIHEGEVVGLAGLLGSGRTEVARLFYGADKADEGHIEFEGRPLAVRGPRTALNQKIAYSSEDRKGEGLIADLTVRENIVLAIQAQRGWLRRLPASQTDEIVERYIKALDIRPGNPDAIVGSLSGGNQQKVLLARWLATAPRLIMLDEPTRGIDVGAKAEIMRLVSELAADGMSVLFISAELEEVLRLSRRVAVLRDRKKIAELENSSADVTVEDITHLIASGGRS